MGTITARKMVLVVLLQWLVFGTMAQNSDTTIVSKDSINQLGEVVINAFYGRSKWKNLPASIAVISSSDMQRYATPTLLPVLNAFPGIRMEERSPGSYRLSIRGSLLRSPFGVRNIKVYWNNLPLTDAGGNTYLNLLDLSQISNALVLKGPVAAAYGSGTGGALLLQSGNPFSLVKKQSAQLGIQGGSYGLFQQTASWQISDSNKVHQLQQSHSQSDGYRQQSAMRRDVVRWQASFKYARQQWQLLAFYSNLFYQTPGGITLAQMQSNPQLARQPAGTLPGAVSQKAAIYNKTFYTGVLQEWQLSGKSLLRSFASFNHTSFRNPFITNYEKRAENNIAVGTQWQYRLFPKLLLTTGGEWLWNHSRVDNFGNKQGQADTVQFRDNITALQWFAFTQFEFIINDKWQISGGISFNNQLFHYQRITDPNAASNTKNLAAVLAPRLALGYRLHQQLTWYATAAKGFSAPTLAELRPSDGNFYGQLNAENGWNVETGVKGSLMGEKLSFDVATYYFKLNQAIVRRNNSAGAEYFINAGNVVQKGIELFWKYQLWQHHKKLINTVTFFNSYSFQPFYFSNYQQGSTSYAGNPLTGVPRHIWVLGVDLTTSNGYYLNCSANMVSRISLTDAADVYSLPYQLLQGKIGYRKNGLHIFAGIDNALNQLYSLGHDINAAGRRFYNPAAPRNFLAGVQIRFR